MTQKKRTASRSRVTGAMKIILAYAVTSGLVLGLQQGASAGFNIVEHGIRAMGRGGAFTAVADDGAAHYYNPAGLVYIEDDLLQSEVILTHRRSRFKTQTGEEDQMRINNANPNLFYVADTGSSNWAWGISAFIPFGSATQWNDHGPLRYTATYSKLGMYVINPNVAMKVTPKLSVGLGLDLYQTRVESRKKINYGALIGQSGQFDGDYVLKAPTTTSAGYNLGVLYKIDEKNRVGASYRSRFSLYLEGEGVIEGIPAFVPGNPRLRSAVRTEYNIPDDIMFGFAHRANEKLDLAFDIQWTNWSQFKDVDLYFDDIPAWNTFTPKNWHDKLIYKAGAEYNLSENMILRAGYAYSTSSIPDATFEPANPDSIRNTVYSGWGYTNKGFAADLACSFTFFNDRTVENSAGVDGTYKSFIPQLALSLSWMF